MSKEILYFPTIEIPDGAWLKNALLYWNSVSSIVPYKGFPMPRNISVLKEYNCYTPIYPEDIIVKNRDEFLTILEKRLYDVRGNEGGFSFLHVNKVPIYENEIFNLHSGAFLEQYPEIRRLFQHANPRGEWWRISKVGATAYMKTLAEFAIADNENMTIGTDASSNVDCWEEGYGKVTDANSLFEIVFDRCILMPDENVSLEKIIEFKKQHGKQLIDFQTEIANVQNNLSGCENFMDITEVLNDFQNKIQSVTKISEMSFKEYSFKYLKGSLKTCLCSLIPIDVLLKGIAHIGDITSFLENNISREGVAMGAVTAVGLHISKAIFKDVLDRHKMLKSNFAYVMHAHQSGMYRKTL